MHNGVLQEWCSGWKEEEKEEEASGAVKEIQEQSQTQSPHYLKRILVYLCACGPLDLQLWWN